MPPGPRATASAAGPAASRPRARRKFGDYVDLLSVALDAQGKPGPRRLHPHHFDEIVGLAGFKPRGVHDQIASLEPGGLGHALPHDLPDARAAVAVLEQHAN